MLAQLSSAQSPSRLTITPTGVPTYTYPLVVPPGIGGMEPRLSLAFSGGSVNGPLGVGWSIQGISTIARCGSTIATDGRRTGVLFQPADRICLDGQRLIQTDGNGTPLASQSDDARGLSSGYREYRTETDSFARIRAYGSSNGSDVNGPQFFQVWTKSGQLYQYGTTADSNIEVQNGTAVAVWAVSRVLDTVGNFIDFSYEKLTSSTGSGPTNAQGAAQSNTGREWNLIEARYTGHGAQAPANKITFTYAARPTADRGETYHQGFKNINSRFLTAVRTYTNAAASPVETKLFQLTYASAIPTQRLRLTAIAECQGADESKCMPATRFSYSDGGSDAYSTTPSAFDLTSVRLFKQDGTYGTLTGDFDGDGKTDIIRWSNTPSENTLYFSRPMASGSIAAPDTLNFAQATNFNIVDQNLNKSDGCYFSIVGDFNGDGMSDILRWASPDGYSANGNQICASGLPSYLYLSKGDGTFKQITLPFALSRRLAITSSCNLNQFWSCSTSAGANFYIGDYNGDGLLDILYAKLPFYPAAPKSGDPGPSDRYDCTEVGGADCTFLYRGNTDGTFTQVTTNLARRSIYTPPNTSYSRQFFDLNADGLQDLHHPSVSKRYLSSGDGNFTAVLNPIVGTGCTALPLDVNGDGKTDFLCTEGPSLAISLGEGNFFLSSQFNVTGSGNEMSGPTNGAVGADINGDGRSDILRWADDPSQNKLWLSNGDGSFRLSNTFNLTNAPLRNSANTYDFVFADFSGRGNVEILRLADDLSNVIYVKSNQTPPELLLTVTTPLGSPTTLSYASLAQADGPYASNRVLGQDPTAATTYPKVILQMPSYVISKVADDSAGNAGGPLESHYSYAGLRGSSDGRGFLGFSDVYQDAQGANGEYLTTRSSFVQDFPYIGYVSQIRTTRGAISAGGASGQLLSLANNSYCDRSASTGCVATGLVRKPFLQQSIEQGWDLGGVYLPVVTTTNAFDTFGNATQISAQTTGSVGGVAQTFTKTVNNTYLPANTAGDNWILGRLSRATTTSTVPDDLLPVSAGSSPTATAIQGSLGSLTLTATPASVTASRPDAGALNGSTQIGVQGGTAPYAYQWVHTTGTVINESGGQTATFTATLTLGQVANETYTVNVTDAVGRTGSLVVPISFSAGASTLTVTITPSPVTSSRSGAGALSATASVSVSGGTAPYNYTWTRVSGSRITVSGTQTATFTATLAASESFTETFSVAVTDAASGTGNKSVNVTFTSSAAGAFNVTVTPSPVTGGRNNPGSASANASISASGGTAPYTYSWARVTGSRITVSGTQAAVFTAPDLGWGENLTETYAAVVTDATNATVTQNVNVTFTTPQQLIATVNPSPLVVNSGSAGTLSGTASVNVTGGTPPFTYTWTRVNGSRISQTGGQTATFTASINAGESITETYNVLVSDSVGNTWSVNENITMSVTVATLTTSVSPSPLVVSLSGAGTAQGTVYTNPSGGVPPYNYQWTRLSGSRLYINNYNTYAVFIVYLENNDSVNETWRSTVTDQAGHTATADFNINFTSAGPPSVSLSPSSIDGVRSGPGSISRTTSVSVSSGSPPFTYSWAPVGSPDISVSGGQTGTFSALLENGEYQSGTFQVTVTDSIGRQGTASIYVVLRSTCLGPCN